MCLEDFLAEVNSVILLICLPVCLWYWHKLT
jgi:hypothetical protein